MPHQLRSRQWQAKCLRASGITYTDPSVVYKDLQEFAHASEVLGKLQTAHELESRITKELCSKYAPLLAVLHSLAHSSRSSSSDYSRALIGNNDDDSTGEFTDFECSSLNEISEISELSEEEEEQPETVPDEAPENTMKAYKQHAIDEIVPLLHTTPLPQLPTHAISHRSMIRELIMLLHDIPYVRTASVRGISPACNNSVWRTFDDLRLRLYDLDQAARQQALSQIRQLQCSTIIQLLIGCEKILVNPPIRPVNTDVINTWLSGTLTIPFQVSIDNVFAAVLPAECKVESAVSNWMKGDSNYDDVMFRSFGLSPQLHHPKLYPAVTVASVAHHAFNLRLRPNLRFESRVQYYKDMYVWYWDLTQRVCDAGLRDAIFQAWNRLSAVYLAQDTRILLFFHEWLTLETWKNQQVAIDMLRMVWPDCGFSLDTNLIPQLHIEMHPYVELWLGHDYSKLFNRTKLGRLWTKAVNGFRQGNQIIELELRELSRQVSRGLQEDCLAVAL